MRPLELTLDGFRSYRTAQTFEFRDRRLIGIVGEIGAGKSSVLDAIAFALFGKTPTIASNTKSLIHQLRDDCHVELRFAVGDDVWQIQRALRRKGQAGHKLVRLAEDTPDATELDPITGDDATKRRVEELLGMDFETFCRSVLLAQNRFSEFLRASPGERDKVLKGVFGFERLDQAHGVAKRRLEAVTDRLSNVAAERSRLEQANAELAAARPAAVAAAERADLLSGHADEIASLGADREEARRAFEQARQAADELASIEGQAPSDDAVLDTVQRAGAAAAQVEEARAAVDDAARRRSEREHARTDLVERLGDPQQLGSFGALVERREAAVRGLEASERQAEVTARAVEKAERHAEKAQAQADAATATHAEIEAEIATALADVERAEDERRAAHRAEMAHELRGHLALGDPCPVCERAVETVPRRRAAPKTAAAEKAVKAAKAALEKARKAELRARQQHTRAESDLAAARTQLEASGAGAAAARGEVVAAQEELARVSEELVERLGEGDPRTLLEERLLQLEAAERDLDDARAGLERAETDAIRVTESAAATLEATGALAARIVGCWGRLGEIREPVADPRALTEARAELVRAIDDRRGELDGLVADLTARDRAGRERLDEIAAELDISEIEMFGDALAQANADRGSTHQRVVDLEAEVERGADLEQRVGRDETRRALLERLEKDLRPSRFLGFLLEEERAELAELGSEHFEQLTAGGYRFSEDDRFDVRDMNAAGRPRKADSLSGGETFLASLALALALAEMVARGGGRLDSFFLDEGFGGLDPDHLALAMEGIGRLVAEDPHRLVVLVSHVREMQDSLEDLIELSKDAVTGDTVVMRGARGISAGV